MSHMMAAWPEHKKEADLEQIFVAPSLHLEVVGQ